MWVSAKKFNNEMAVNLMDIGILEKKSKVNRSTISRIKNGKSLT